MELQTAYYTHIGGRSCNEDSVRLYQHPRGSLCVVVADGLGGHGGGDHGIMRDFLQILRHGGESRTNANISLQSHLICFAAERSRKEHIVVAL